MGKWIFICKKCNKEFEGTTENQEHKDGRFHYRCTYCNYLDYYEIEEENYRSLTIDEAVEVAKCLKEGRDHKYLEGHVDLPIGHEKKCKKCGRLTDVVEYNSCLGYSENYSTMCSCEEKPYPEDWFEPCDDKDCEFHKNVDTEKFRKEKDDYKVRDDIIEQIFEKYPPENDGILELDRIAYIFNTVYGKESTNGSRAYVFDSFMIYCAEKGMLRK